MPSSTSLLTLVLLALVGGAVQVSVEIAPVVEAHEVTSVASDVDLVEAEATTARAEAARGTAASAPAGPTPVADRPSAEPPVRPPR